MKNKTKKTRYMLIDLMNQYFFLFQVAFKTVVYVREDIFLSFVIFWNIVSIRQKEHAE